MGEEAKANPSQFHPPPIFAISPHFTLRGSPSSWASLWPCQLAERRLSSAKAQIPMNECLLLLPFFQSHFKIIWPISNNPAKAAPEERVHPFVGNWEEKNWKFKHFSAYHFGGHEMWPLKGFCAELAHTTHFANAFLNFV